jgi:hypothetical protein
MRTVRPLTRVRSAFRPSANPFSGVIASSLPASRREDGAQHGQALASVKPRTGSSWRGHAPHQRRAGLAVAPGRSGSSASRAVAGEALDGHARRGAGQRDGAHPGCLPVVGRPRPCAPGRQRRRLRPPPPGRGLLCRRRFPRPGHRLDGRHRRAKALTAGAAAAPPPPHPRPAAACAPAPRSPAPRRAAARPGRPRGCARPPLPASVLSVGGHLRNHHLGDGLGRAAGQACRRCSNCTLPSDKASVRGSAARRGRRPRVEQVICACGNSALACKASASPAGPAPTTAKRQAVIAPRGNLLRSFPCVSFIIRCAPAPGAPARRSPWR